MFACTGPTLQDYLDDGWTAEDYAHDYPDAHVEIEEGDIMDEIDPDREHRHTAAQYGVGRHA